MVIEGKGLAEIGAKQYNSDFLLRRHVKIPRELRPKPAPALSRSGLSGRADGGRAKAGRPPAKRAGLLHDIGKTVSREMEGSRWLGIESHDLKASIAKELAEHHEDNERMSSIGFLVKAADTFPPSVRAVPRRSRRVCSAHCAGRSGEFL